MTKSDRHLQLINTNVFEKESQARTKAIEQTRLQKQQQRNDRERSKLFNHFNRAANGTAVVASTNASVAANYEVTLDGIRFRVTKNGSKLVKLPGVFSQPGQACSTGAYAREGDNNPPTATPKTATIAGVKFYRSKNGNLYRHGIVKAQRYVALSDGMQYLTQSNTSRSGAIKKIDQPCQVFSTTGISLLHFSDPATTDFSCQGHGMFSGNLLTCTLCASGSCPKGPQCRYNHNPSTVAVCKDFLQRGECANGDSCDLSHLLTPERTPTCVHFLKGNCSNTNCRFTHVKVAPSAPVCRAFGFYGYCENGIDCTDRHVFECPDFSNTGICKNKRCKLPHRERASVLRKAAAAREQKPEKEEEDISSDDDDGDAVDSDDVDSDEVEEFIGEDDSLAVEFTDQKDFIQL